jgi:hypothetical protein
LSSGWRLELAAGAEGDALDEVASEGVLEAEEDFLSAITDDFVAPDIAIDTDEESAFMDAGGLGVGGDGGVDEVVPDFDDFGF